MIITASMQYAANCTMRKFFVAQVNCSEELGMTKIFEVLDNGEFPVPGCAAKDSAYMLSHVESLKEAFKENELTVYELDYSDFLELEVVKHFQWSRGEGGRYTQKVKTCVRIIEHESRN